MTAVTADLSVGAEAIAFLASDGDATGLLDAGDGSGLATGGGGELAVPPAYPGLQLEITTGAKLVTDRWAPLESVGTPQHHSPPPIEAGGHLAIDSRAPAASRRVTAAAQRIPSEAAALLRLDPVVPIAGAAGGRGEAPLGAEIGSSLRADHRLGGQLRAAILRHLGGRIELPAVLRADTPAALQAAASALTQLGHAILRIESLPISRADIALVGEVRGTYVLEVTLTLSDGRVITFPATAASTAVS